MSLFCDVAKEYMDLHPRQTYDHTEAEYVYKRRMVEQGSILCGLTGMILHVSRLYPTSSTLYSISNILHLYPHRHPCNLAEASLAIYRGWCARYLVAIRGDVAFCAYSAVFECKRTWVKVYPWGERPSPEVEGAWEGFGCDKSVSSQAMYSAYPSCWMALACRIVF